MEGLYELHNYGWEQIPNEPYVLKYKITESGYSLLVSNFTSIYGEALEATDVKTRFTDLNQNTDMKPSFIMKNISKSLDDLLQLQARKHELVLQPNQMIITLKFPAKYINYKYEIKLDILPSEQMVNFIVGPTIMYAMLSMKKVKELENKIERIENIGLEELKSDEAKASTSKERKLVDPTWLEGEAPPEVIADSFVELQFHFNDLRTENFNLLYPIPDDQEEEEFIKFSGVSFKNLEKQRKSESLGIQYENLICSLPESKPNPCDNQIEEDHLSDQEAQRRNQVALKKIIKKKRNAATGDARKAKLKKL